MIRGGSLILLVEDMVNIIVMVWLTAWKFVDLGPLMPLLCLHCMRSLILLAVVAFQEATFAWLLPVCSASMAMSCAFAQFAKPFHFMTHLLLGQAAASTILATVTCCLLKHLHMAHDQQDTSVSHVVSEDAVKTKVALAQRTRQVAAAQDLDLEHQTVRMICMSDFKQDEVLVELTCGHVHHDTCIRTWSAQGRAICPLRCDFGSSPVAVWQTDDHVGV